MDREQTESGETLAASAAHCLAEIAAELGCEVEALPGRIVQAVVTYGCELGQEVQRSADVAATTRPAPAHEDAGKYSLQVDEVTRVDRLRRKPKA